MKSHNNDFDDFTPSGEINVTPMIDVMLVLLLIFMVVAPISTVNVPVELPSASSKATPPEQKTVTISMKDDHSIYVMDEKVSDESIVSALQQQGATPETTLYLRIDKNVNYGQSLALLDTLREGNYTKVALVGLGDKG